MSRQEEGFVFSRSQTHRGRVAGFTLLEMIIVLVTMGLLLTIVTRAVRGSWLAASRRSASRDMTAYLYRARGVAVQQSRTAWLVRSGDILKILVDSSGTAVQLGAQVDFWQRYGGHLSASPKDTIQFDPRGFAVGSTLPSPKFVVALGGRIDTVCVTGLGKITTRSCP